MGGRSPQDSGGTSAGRPWFFWLTIAAGLFFVAFGCFAGAMIANFVAVDRYGFEATARDGGQFVSDVNPLGRARGVVEIGDRILAVAGDQRFARVDPVLRLRPLVEGESYPIRFARRGVETTAQLVVS